MMTLTRIFALLVTNSLLYHLCLGHPVGDGSEAFVSGADQARRMTIGTRVIRGPDWTYGNHDGIPPGEGQIVRELYGDGVVNVRWDAGLRGPGAYRMGQFGKYDLILATDAQIRLVGGGDDGLSGRVEINHDGKWGVVCDVGWGTADGDVVCRQIDDRLHAVAAKTGSFYGESELPIVMSRVACNGTESRLSQCPFVCKSSYPCDSSHLAGVDCKPKEDSVRLVDGDSTLSGRVEIYRDGSWGTVCDNNWDSTDAAVVCQQLGYNEFAEAKTGAHFGEGTGPVHMDGVACDGSEGKLAECPSFCWETTQCSHSQDAGVVCRN